MAGRGKTHLLFVGPAMVALAGVTLYPGLYVLWLSLHRRLLIFDISRFVGFENYRFLWRDARFWKALS
ncbi:MAG: sugar ABC transporter permease, partial [Candidatus Tectimicrobiota bacterium]